MGVTQGWFQARFSEDWSKNPALKLSCFFCLFMYLFFFYVFFFFFLFLFFFLLWQGGDLNFMHG